MRAVVQRVAAAQVEADGRCVGRIGKGLFVLLGVGVGDEPDQAGWLAQRIAHLRIFPDRGGRMNESVAEAGGGVLVVSQFTLYGDCRKGRRPNFMAAAPPQEAEPLYNAFVEEMRKHVDDVQTGRFGAMMRIAAELDGPVTLLVEAPERT